ncbi:MAG: sulfatase [Planctomycetota bacterium]|nr:sulfatase [Planctomycetota bacterium]
MLQTSNRPRRAPRILGLGLLLLGACGGGGKSLRGVVHLDPRLEDGGSSTELLAAAIETTRTWTFDAGQHPDWTRVRVPFEDRANRAWEWQAGSEALAAETVTSLAWRGTLTRSTRARLSWRTSEDPEGSWPGQRTAEISVPADPTGAELRHFDLGSHPSWTGEVVALRFEPDGLLGIEAGLSELRLERSGFGGGLEPLGEGSADGGLVVLDGYARRTWPAAFGMPLFAEVLVPADGRLVLDVALAAHLRTALERVHLAVDVAKPGTDGLAGLGWERLWYRSVVPRMAPTETLWTAATVDLSAYAGETVRLRLRAWSGHGKDDVEHGLDGGSSQAAVLWGAPEVLGDQGPDLAPHILLVTLDTTRADALDPGAGLAHAPFLAELAETGIRFTTAFAASNATQPSHASILTGAWPTDHGVRDNYSVLVDGNVTLPERLRELGYHSLGAVSQRYIGAGAGYGQGFDEFVQPMPDASIDGGSTIQGLRKRVAELVEQDPDRPLFLWLHLFDPHTPYQSPEGYAAGHAERFGPGPAARVPAGTPGALPDVDVLPEEFEFLAGINNLERVRHLYGVGVDYADALVENLASSLATAGVLGRTAFFVTADHGESLGERSSYFNHQGLYPEVVRVPLIVRVPGGPAGLEVTDAVSGVDVAPTILRYAAGGRQYDDRFLRGRDLLAGLVTESVEPDGEAVPAAERLVFFEHAGERQVGLRAGKWHFIATFADDMLFGVELVAGPDGKLVPREKPVPNGHFELYDVEADPGLTSNLAEQQPALAESFLHRIYEWRADAFDLTAGAETARETTAAERDELDKLGY